MPGLYPSNAISFLPKTGAVGDRLARTDRCGGPGVSRVSTAKGQSNSVQIVPRIRRASFVVMYFLAAFTTIAASLLASVAVAYFPAYWLARRAGLPNFRMFEVSSSGRLVERAAVRLVSVIAPLLLVFITATATLLATGEAVVTNQVEVLPGPAMAAGLRSGDRIVSVDGVATPEFEDIRRQVKNGKPSHDLVIERDSETRAVRVVPDQTGAIKVTAAAYRRSIGPSDAMGKVAHWIARFSAGAAASGSERLALVGPVAIVKSVGTSRSTNLSEWSLWVACYVGCSVTLLVTALHLFDGLTYGWFTISSKLRSSALLRGTFGRRRQALGLALLLGLVGLGAVTALEIAGIRLGFSVEVVPKVLLTLAIPLAWLVARELYGLRRASALAMLFFVPLLNVVVLFGLWFVAGRVLRHNDA